MGAELILAIDQGTTNTKALLIDRNGVPLFRTASPVDIAVSSNGFVEQDPLAIWQSVQAVIDNAARHAQSIGAHVAAAAISNQRETAIAWSRSTGKPLAPAIGWQCGRSAHICDRLADKSNLFRTKTGLPLAPLVSAGKWAWLLENDTAVQEASQESDLCCGTVDSWLVHCLTGADEYVTDLTNASRTGLLNLKTRSWDTELLSIFGIPAEAMPMLQPSAGNFGKCSAVSAISDTPILSAIGDSHAAMFGHGHFTAGSVKATYGTGSSLMALTESLLDDTPTLARTIAWSAKQKTQFAIEGNIPMTGSAIQWLGDFLSLPDRAVAVASLSECVDDADGVYFVPAMLGLGAPHWDTSARGTISGLCRNHTTAHLARAALDAIAYQIADVLFAIELATGASCNELLVDGGATRNSKLMQFQADILNRPVIRSRNEELSAVGAGWLAGLELGWWKSLSDLKSIPQDVDRFEPQMPESRRTNLYAGWKNAIAASKSLARRVE